MRRSLVFVLTLLFVFTVFAGPAAPKADAVIVSSVIVGTVIAAMAAAGIGLTVSGMTSSQLSDWVSGKLNDWATSIGGSVEDHINGNLITVTAQGIISVATSAAQGIASFLGWLETDENLQDNNVHSVISGAVNVPIVRTQPDKTYVENNGTQLYKQSSGNIAQVVLYTTNNNIVSARAACFYSGWAYNVYVGFYSSTNLTSQSTAYCIKLNSRPGDTYLSTEGLYSYNSTYNVVYAVPFSPSNITDMYIPVFDSEIDCLRAIAEGGGSLSIDTDVIQIPTIDSTAQDKWFLDVGAAPGTTIEIVTDGVIADTIAGDLTVSGEVSEEEPEFVVDGPIAIEGLAQVFPFCIPFDIYALLSCLSAEPQTPVFTVRFVVPGVINQEFTIDLSPFNTVAQIVRTLELLAFIVGLALVTRQRFLRS